MQKMKCSFNATNVCSFNHTFYLFHINELSLYILASCICLLLSKIGILKMLAMFLTSKHAIEITLQITSISHNDYRRCRIIKHSSFGDPASIFPACFLCASKAIFLDLFTSAQEFLGIAVPFLYFTCRFFYLMLQVHTGMNTLRCFIHNHTCTEQTITSSHK